MKKNNLFITLTLILALTVVFTGCGGDSAADISGQVTPATEAAHVPVSLGRVEGGSYTNKYVGFGCELDSDWAFYTAEELQELPENVAELLEGSELVGDEMPTQITDMMAENVTDLTTINVLYQKLSMQERLSYLAMDEEDIVDGILSQVSTMTDAYAQAGIVVDRFEKVTVTFLGEERTALWMAASIQDTPYYTLQIFDYDLGNYAVTTTLASYVEDSTGNLLELFFAVE